MIIIMMRHFGISDLLVKRSMVKNIKAHFNDMDFFLFLQSKFIDRPVLIRREHDERPRKYLR